MNKVILIWIGIYGFVFAVFMIRITLDKYTQDILELESKIMIIKTRLQHILDGEE